MNRLLRNSKPTTTAGSMKIVDNTKKQLELPLTKSEVAVKNPYPLGDVTNWLNYIDSVKKKGAMTLIEKAKLESQEIKRTPVHENQNSNTAPNSPNTESYRMKTSSKGSPSSPSVSLDSANDDITKSSPDICHTYISTIQDVGEITLQNESMFMDIDSELEIEEAVDFGFDTSTNPVKVGLYAADIFAYHKRREVQFPVPMYLRKQPDLQRDMRSVLVDWMVEVQENFELENETLYMAVKLLDLFLSKKLVTRNILQLVGATTLYISAKYHQISPPKVRDFCFVCADAYIWQDVILMEKCILKALNFDIGVPLSYNFLRRYVMCANLGMEILTFARFILEMSLMEYDFVGCIESKLAAGALLLALVLRDIKDPRPWSKTLEYYSGYSVEELSDFTHRLHAYLIRCPAKLTNIRLKYSDIAFFEVSKISIPMVLNL